MSLLAAAKVLALSGLGASLAGCGGDTTTAAPKPTDAPAPGPSPPGPSPPVTPTVSPTPSPLPWPNSVAEVWNSHFDAFATGNISKIMLDYDENSLIATFNDNCAGSASTALTVGYMEYKGVAAIQGFFTALFKQLTDEDSAKTPASNVTDIGPLSTGTPSVMEDAVIAGNSVFLTWRTKEIARLITYATDTFTFRKVGDAFKIDKQNIVSTEETTAGKSPCSDGAGYDKTAMTACTGSKVCDGWANHFAAFGEQNVSKIMLDYTAKSVVQVYDNAAAAGSRYSSFKTLGEITQMFTDLFAQIGPNLEGLAVKVLDVDKDKSTVFLVWETDSHPRATDTFIFDSEGKILTQTIVVSRNSTFVPNMTKPSLFIV